MKTYRNTMAALGHLPLNGAARSLIASSPFQSGIEIHNADDGTVHVKIWANPDDADRCYADQLWICSDGDTIGGDINVRPDGNAYVDLGDGTRLDADTGEIINPDFI